MRRFVLAAIAALMTCVSMLAQVPGTGAYPFASFDNRGFDSINLGNNNIRFTIPIVTRTGRGLPFNYAIQYEGLVWAPVTSGPNTAWVPASGWGFTGVLNGTAFIGYMTHNTSSNACGNDGDGGRGTGSGFQYQTSGYAYHDGYGAIHPFSYTYISACSDGSTTPEERGGYTATDGSGYTLTNYGAQIRTKTGVTITPGSAPGAADSESETDSNGNQITFNGSGTFTDTTGTPVLSISGSGPLTFSYPVTRQANGATMASASLSYKSYTVRTNFQVAGVVEYGSNTVNLVDRITLADGSFYAFGYEGTPGATDGAVTARIASVTLPTGGVVSYTYRFGWPGSIATDGTPAGLTRTTADGSKQYNHDIDGYPATTSITIDEKGNETDYTFVGSTNGNNYETGRSVYQGSNSSGAVPLLTRTSTYNGQSTTQLTSPIAEVDVTTSYNGGSQSLVKNGFDASGNLLNSAQYNGSALLENSTYTYNQNSEVQTAVTTDGSNNTVSSVTYGYDETTPTATSNIPQHAAVSGGIRGNQTSSQVSTGSGTLTTTTAYYDTGMPVSSTDPGNFQTTYGYDSTQTFTTSITYPTPPSGVALSTSASYDTASAAVLSTTGLNAGQTTIINNYDAVLRPTSVSLPSGSTATSTITPNRTDVYAVLDTTTGQTGHTAVQVDGYGRTNRTATYNGQSSNPWYQADTCYDATGLLMFQSAPYQSTGFNSSIRCSGAGTNYQYDALGRMTSVSNSDGTSSTSYLNRAVQTTDVNGVERISQYDLLGRLAGVCEISSTAMGNDTPSACGMDINGSGYSTIYSYNLAAHSTTINQGAAQQRVFQTDAAGRTILVSEPERGQTTYSYAYNSGGLVMTRTRPSANQTNPSTLTTTTTQYDDLGRISTVNYNDGITYPKQFGYDAISSDWNTPSTYSAGLLTSVTDGSRTATVFGHDISGNVNVVKEIFHGFAYSHAHDMTYSYVYNAAGLLTSESYPSLAYTGSPVTNTYTYTAAAELQSITQTATHAGTAQNISIYAATSLGPNGTGGYQTANNSTTSIGYDTLGRATGSVSCLGGTPAQSGVSCASGQMIHGYSLAVQGSQVTQINDTIGGTNTPGYDSFGRLQSVNWPSPGVFMNWTYDRYGNRLTQTLASGSTASEPQPVFSYDPGTNHNTSYSYDAAGNVTSGGITYDAEGMAVGYADGTVHVYDPLGHLVHEYISGGYNRLYAYGVNNRREAILDGAANMLTTQVYLGSQPLTYYTLANNTYTYQYQNQVGSEAARETAGQITTFSSLPFGDAPGIGGAGQDTDAYHFAGMDVSQSYIPFQQSSTHHAQFRDYTSISGQWLSPDPSSDSYSLGNPQSFNRYTYALNNPYTLSDVNGLDPCTPANNYCTVTPDPCATDPNCVTVTADPPVAVPFPVSPTPPWFISEYGGPTCGYGGGSNIPCSSYPTSPTVTSTPPKAAPPRTTAAPTKNCTNKVGTGGVGVGAGYNADLGVGAAGASSTGGVGGGLFHNSGGGLSGGLFGSGGVAAYFGSHVAGAPSQTSSSFVLGAYAGAGASFFFTNAGGVQQLRGPFTTVSINVGVGNANLGVQLSFGGGIWQLGVTPPVGSVGIGAAGSVIRTNTITTHAGC